MNLFRKTDIPTFDKPIGGSVVAIIWQKIVIELPKYVESNASQEMEKLFFHFLLKFVFSKKATKIDKIFTVNLKLTKGLLISKQNC